MTTYVDLVNRALQVVGTRSVVNATELANNSTNEAKEANKVIHSIRKQLLRMAPWGCGMTTDNLVYITSVPGTPENLSTPGTQWQRGLPTPPWTYEYQYPADCIVSCFIIPGNQTGFAGAVPISPVSTGFSPAVWAGEPVRYAVQTDQFRPVTAAAVAAGGTGYAVGDIITLATGPTDEAPIGAPAKLQVASVSGSAVATVDVVSQVIDSDPELGGSYFGIQTNPVAQGSTDGSGTGATFNLTQGAAQAQRVILTNQANAVMVYVKNVTDPNLFDDAFQEAYVRILGATLCQPLAGDKKLAGIAIDMANRLIEEARVQDAGEGLTINDVTPDWIRIRGFSSGNTFSGPFAGFDWGGLWPAFG